MFEKMSKRGPKTYHKQLLKIWSKNTKELQYSEILKSVGKTKSALADLNERTIIRYLQELTEQDILERRVDKNRQVYYKPKGTEGRKETLREIIKSYIDNADTKTEKLDERSEFYFTLLNTFRDKFLERSVDQNRVKKIISKIPKLRDFLLEKEIDYAETNARINAWIITQCLDIYVYSEGQYKFSPGLWFETYDWIAKMFEWNLDEPEKMGTGVISVMFNGDKAKLLMEKPEKVLAGEAFSHYVSYLWKQAEEWRSYEERRKQRPPPPSCFRDLKDWAKKYDEDTPYPERCQKCNWFIDCIVA